MKRALALLAVAVLIVPAVALAEQEPELAKWQPYTGGPQFGISAEQALRQLPVHFLDYDAERPALSAAELRAIGRQRGGGLAQLHKAGERRLAPSGPVAKADVISTEHQAAEPTMGVTRDGTLFYAALQGQDTKLLRSRDGGRTWQELDPLIPGTHSDEVTFDPFMYVDPITDRLFNADLTTPNCAGISMSDDAGETFAQSTNCNHADHQNLFAGPAPDGGTQPSGYKNVVYYCSTDGGATLEATGTGCSKSLDGGTTWLRSGDLPYVNDPSRTGGSFGIPGFCSGATGHGIVGPDGTVYLPRGWCDQPYLAISHDEGLTWTKTQVADLGMIVGIEDEVIGSSAGFAVEDHEASVAADPDGNLFYFWIARDHMPYLAISRDGGKSFGKPLMVAAPGVNEAWGPSIDAGERGKIAFAYLGTTNSPGGPYCTHTTGTTTCETDDGRPATPASAYENTTWNGYMGMSADALAASPTFQSASVNDPSDPFLKGAGCGPVRCLAELDFIDISVAADGTSYAAFVDGCDGPDNCGSSGTGVVGHLTGGPPLAAPQLPPSTPAKSCTRAQKLRVKGRRVTVNGRRVKVRRGVALVDLRRYRGRTVRIVARRGGKRVMRRTYRVCA